MHHRPITVAVLGAGGRGTYFATWLRDHPHWGTVVAVAEPNPARRQRVAEMFKLPADRQFERWDPLLAQPRLADAVINTTMDRLHAPSATKALALGYHMLLEKPMATTLADCIAIDQAQKRAGTVVSICHSLRYHVVFAEVKRLLRQGAIGEVVSFDQLEGVGDRHQSHSFVRGNWGNESRSTFMLMSKSCHDVDLVSYLVDRPCLRVSSFGSLSYFRKENAPPGAPSRCTDGCPVEQECVYSALKIYFDKQAWFAAHAGASDLSVQEKLDFLAKSPYGQCAFQADNDVVDHQVVAFEYEGGVTGTFTMTAFHPGGRYLRVHGTKGYLSARVDESNNVEVHRFDDRATQTITLPQHTGGHGGADDNVIRNFISAVRSGDPDAVLTTTAQSLATHKIVFAAELARREKRVVELSELESAADLELPASVA